MAAPNNLTFWGMCHNFLWHVPRLFVACATTIRSMCPIFLWDVPDIFEACATTFVACGPVFVASDPYFKACGMLITTSVASQTTGQV